MRFRRHTENIEQERCCRMKLSKGMLLFHGSYTSIENIQLEMCAAGKDFGRGFYLTSNAIQARQFLKTSVSKAQRLGDAPLTQNYGFEELMPNQLEDQFCFLTDKAVNCLEFVEARQYVL